MNRVTNGALKEPIVPIVTELAGRLLHSLVVLVKKDCCL